MRMNEESTIKFEPRGFDVENHPILRRILERDRKIPTQALLLGLDLTRNFEWLEPKRKPETLPAEGELHDSSQYYYGRKLP